VQIYGKFDKKQNDNSMRAINNQLGKFLLKVLFNGQILQVCVVQLNRFSASLLFAYL
jgi:hypothetical protein